MGRYLAGSDIGVPVLGLRPTRAGRKWSEKLAKPRISIRPPPTRHAAIWSSIIFTGSSTSRSTIWDCSCAIRWISWDFVIGPLSRVRCGAATLGATRRLQPSVSLALRTTCREVHRTAHPAHIRSAPRPNLPHCQAAGVHARRHHRCGEQSSATLLGRGSRAAEAARRTSIYSTGTACTRMTPCARPLSPTSF